MSRTLRNVDQIPVYAFTVFVAAIPMSASSKTSEVSQATWGDAKTVGRMTGISRSVLYRLEAEGKIRSASLRAEGKQRGKKLFCLDSIQRFLESCVTSPATGGDKPEQAPVHE
ncbi:MAG: hypothetical protein EOP84_03645 [Verrucomicrobiaceae bacterium]|nr:MAG: hypothetical protein EOP84_03645 [Verrucomicrobiaceae bacterium]